MTSLFLILSLFQDPTYESIVKKYQETVPPSEELAFYRLDWEPSLEKARARAAKEGRPIFLVLIHNKNSYSNLYTGYC